MTTVIHNAALTVKSSTFPVYVLSALMLSIGTYLYGFYDIAHVNIHYAFLPHPLAAPLFAIPFGLSTNERRRFEDLGYTYSFSTKAVFIITGYAFLASVSASFMSTYCLGHGALADALKVLMWWAIIMGANLVPTWFLAQPQTLRPQAETPPESKK